MTTLTEVEAPRVPPARRTPLTGVSVTVATRDALNRFALDLSAQLGRRISLSALVAALHDVGQRHRDEVLAQLAEPTPSGGSDT
jgi:hypothetical protein